MKKRYQKMIGDRKILMPIADAQQLMVIADIICGSKTYNDGLRKVIDIIDATVLAS